MNYSRRLMGLAILFIVVVQSGTSGGAAPLRVLPAGQLPDDRRLQPLKDLDGYFPFEPPLTVEEWNVRSEWVRRQMLVFLGLWPLPSRTPLNAVVHGQIEAEGYTVEKVYFESVPGFFVTGNLYRPRDQTGQRPGVLCPHGHWDDGRFLDSGREEVRQQIVRGAERFEEGGRSVLQSRCVQLARMGCVVFHYDMIGYADSTQITMEVAHRFAKQRPEMNTPEGWGLFSPAAEAHCQSVMGLQTWNSMRALDFLTSLPEVDPARIGVTGASGGGTQTFILCALDPRPAVAFPAVMVSTAMQGGCSCENASGLRMTTGNVEFAALFAPKPLGLTSANDWTREMATKGFPQLQQLYTLLGASNRVWLHRGEQFEHNYNYVSRAAMYRWFNQHLRLGAQEPVVEEDYHRLTRAELTVWDEKHPQPKGGPDFERRLLQWLTEDARRQLTDIARSASDYRRIVGGAIEAMIGRPLAGLGQVEARVIARADYGDYGEITGLARNLTHGEECPAVYLRPKQWQGPVIIWATGTGKAGLFEPSTDGGRRPKPQVQRLLDGGAVVVGIDLFMQGEFLADGQGVTHTRRVKNPREVPAYTFGYNHSLFAQRVHDLLTVVQLTRMSDPRPKAIGLVGVEGAGPWVAAAQAVAGNAVDQVVLDTGGFRFGRVPEVQDPNFLPGGAKYFDLPGMVAARAPGALLLGGEGAAAVEFIQQVYNRAGARDRLEVVDARASGQLADRAVTWLLAGSSGTGR